ncbi:hypothetical protein NBRC10512_005661 [Rhodotorula toruloides]|uniref:RHTO0S15e00364g1_1 n=2 Tax=Rhodotorula toruloides TaxID=5286 RepID=A0A061BCI2_RHOTO|nr:uncharacterized protein RHTO_03289 [Rhodotorula toruloides NP11]EMS25560.1 hypothetical protein RHTO_03289 [Rhodotorula toruloides NP11]CDR47663.1 RHTO0S15e00364g1_1 [Rhodotorula toruloides]
MLKRPLDSGGQAEPAPRRARRVAADFSPTPPDHLDSLVHALAEHAGTGQCPPAWSSTTNLLAIALPADSARTTALHPIFSSNPTSDAGPQTLVSLGIHLSHLESRDANTPRTNVRLDIPLPPLPPTPQLSTNVQPDNRRISLLSWSPDSSQLLAVVSSPSPTASEADLLALFEHSGACIDDGWNLVLLEAVSRFGAPLPATPPGRQKKAVAVRWVGEPRRWYPAPTGLQTEGAGPRRPLYCAPPRSAPLEGTAFVCVLSSEELLFVHLPPSPRPPLASPTPLITCLPLSPAPTPSTAPESKSEAPDSAQSTSSLLQSLSAHALPTPLTPLPLAASLSLALPIDPTAIALPQISLVPKVETAATPTGAIVDALVTSLLPATATATAAAPAATTSSQALQQELIAQQGHGGSAGDVEVERAAIGASRSRGTAEVGETVFVVAWRRKRRKRVSRTVGRVKGVEKDDVQQVKDEGMPPPPVPAKEEKQNDSSTMMLDDDFSLLADFTSLDEAFGDPVAALSSSVSAPAAAPVAEETKKQEGGDETEVEMEEWARAVEEDANRSEEDKWVIELSEVRVEMCDADGPRLTVRPQPPLHVDPSPAAPNDDIVPSDPLLTHLTFLGDVSLPHPLQLTSHSPSLAADGSEASIDLCLLVVTAHRTRSEAGEGWTSTLSSFALSKDDHYVLSDAFHALEPAPNGTTPASNDGEDGGSWNARPAARAMAPEGGVLVGVEIRPGGGEWASAVGAVAVPRLSSGEESKTEDGARRAIGRSWETKIVRLSSVLLEALDKGEDDATPFVLPGSQLYPTLTISPNGALLCAFPFASSSIPSQPLIAAAPLGSSSNLEEKLATRLAIAIARMGDAGDLVGRIKGLGSAEAVTSVLSQTHEILRTMLPAGTMLESSALGLELLGIASALFRSHVSLHEAAETTDMVLELAACARALRKAEKKERSNGKGWKPDSDAIWPLVGHCVWYCSTFLDSLARACLASPTSPAPQLLILLHPFLRTLLKTTTSSLLSFQSYLSSGTIAPAEIGSTAEAVDLAKSVVEDAVASALGGKGLKEWAGVLAKIEGEMDGGPQLSNISPAPFATLSIPPSLEPQAMAIRSTLASTFPSYAHSKEDGNHSGPPTPPRTPQPRSAALREWDIARRARLASVAPQGSRECVRCGRRTSAVEGLPGEAEVVGKWRRYESEWEGRCVCGGMWRRVRL